MRNDAAAPLIGFIVLAIMALLFSVSRWLGASFASVGDTALSLIVCAGMAYAAWRILRDFGLPLIAGFFVLGWPLTWRVLDSIANGGREADAYFNPISAPLINSSGVKWGVEVIFVMLLAVAIYLHRRMRSW